MLSTYTAKYVKIRSGYMGQLVEWPEVITEGKTLEECREMIQDALHEMIIAYQQQNKEIPVGRALLEQIPVEVEGACLRATHRQVGKTLSVGGFSHEKVS